MKLNQPITVGTLFSGIGSPEVSLNNLKVDYKIIFGCEIDKFCRQTYLSNHTIEETHFHEDITEMDGTVYRGKVDILVYGSPCQSFSTLGQKQHLDDLRGDLFFESIRIIHEVQPRVVIFENVRGILHKTKEDGKGFVSQVHPDRRVGFSMSVVETMFQSLGYHFTWEVLNTKDYGIPHQRHRVFLVGFKQKSHLKKFIFPEKSPEMIPFREIMESEVDSKYFKSPDQVKKYRKRNEEENRNIPILKVDEIRHVPSLTRGYNGGGTGELVIDLDDGTFRKLTPLECQRLQGFPEDFKTPVSDTQKYRQFGNSMSVPVMEGLIKSVLDVLGQDVSSHTPVNNHHIPSVKKVS